MSQQFLAALPKIPIGDLPTDSTCMICLNGYSANPHDNDGNGPPTCQPVRLPCSHHVGLACISIWLSPTNIGQNSCPYCRARFFPARARPWMEHGPLNNELMPPRTSDIDDSDYDSDEYDENEPVRPILVLGNSIHEMARRIGRIGRALDDGSGSFETDPDRRSQGMYSHFFQRTAAQYAESLERARAISTETWSEMHISAESNDPQLAEAMERQIAALATSFRTLAFREMVLYISLMAERPRGLPGLPSPSDPLADLDAEQEEALFLELERQGAFEGDSHRAEYASLSNRERWQMHRERDGEVWMYSRGIWAGIGGD